MGVRRSRPCNLKRPHIRFGRMYLQVSLQPLWVRDQFALQVVARGREVGKFILACCAKLSDQHGLLIRATPVSTRPSIGGRRTFGRSNF
ncbi:hypothetical protein BDI4_1080068 [Burkholderia diffusa]|nr:hypothetical protein BDI4_1080068 [Burkholderia diffusa]